MLVLVTSAAPPGLRGELTRWLLEIAPGVYVGHLSARVREKVWELTQANIRNGRAIMVIPARNEQRLEFLTCGDAWEPVTFDGLKLVRRREKNSGQRSEEPATPRTSSTRRDTAWSIAGRRRHFRTGIERRSSS